MGPSRRPILALLTYHFHLNWQIRPACGRRQLRPSHGTGMTTGPLTWQVPDGTIYP